MREFGPFPTVVKLHSSCVSKDSLTLVLIIILLQLTLQSLRLQDSQTWAHQQNASLQRSHSIWTDTNESRNGLNGNGNSYASTKWNS